jgi:16S rRNA (cytosine1402-N4)-methyltransferase
VHVSVLASEALEWLRVRPNGTYVDCTAGAGGHAEQIARELRGGRLIAIDRDSLAVELATERLRPYPNAQVVQDNYRHLQAVLEQQHVEQVDGILIDAGVSSMQLDDGARGFSFQEDAPLDMRMDRSSGVSAADYLQGVSEQELVRVLKAYGDVGPAKRIAKAIVQRRRGAGLRTTTDLASTVEDALDFVSGTPAEVRTVFQAIRIAVNDELRGLEDGLVQAIDALAPEGRLVVITFHSGEDRVSKNILRAASRTERVLAPDGRVQETIPPRVKVLTRKPVLPSAEEVRSNRRAQSAKLRAAERLPAA